MASATQSVAKSTRQALEAGEGILRLAPTWSPGFTFNPGADSSSISVTSLRTEHIAEVSTSAGLHPPRRP